MTIVLGVVREGFVVLAADSRLTQGRGAEGRMLVVESVDDDVRKLAVDSARRVAIASAGDAFSFGPLGETLDELLSSIEGAVDPASVAAAVREQMPEPRRVSVALASFNGTRAELHRVVLKPDEQDVIGPASSYVRFLPSIELCDFYTREPWIDPSVTTPEDVAAWLVRAVEAGIAEEARLLPEGQRTCGGIVRAVIVDEGGARFVRPETPAAITR